MVWGWSRVPAHAFVVLDRPPLRVHRDLGAIEASMEGRRDKAGRMPHRRVGHAREQVDQPLLIRGLDGEDVDERDEQEARS